MDTSFLQRCSDVQRLGTEEGQTSCLYFCWGCKMSRSFLQLLFYSYLSSLMLCLLAVPWRWRCGSAFLLLSTSGCRCFLCSRRLLRRCGLSGGVGGCQRACSPPVPKFLILPFILALRSFHGTSLGSHWEV